MTGLHIFMIEEMHEYNSLEGGEAVTFHDKWDEGSTVVCFDSHDCYI